MITKWTSVVGFEGYYEVSDTGIIRSVERLKIDTVGRKRVFPSVFIKRLNGHSGYFQVNLYKNGMKTKRVARVVAEAFIPNPDNKPQVNHKDGNKGNNCVSNLEWVTSLQNIRHSIDNGLKVTARGEDKILASKLKNENVLYIRSSQISNKELAKKYNVSTSCISLVKQRKTWKHL